MNFTVDAMSLRKALAVVAPAIAKRSTVTALQMVRATVVPGLLKLAATDNEIYAEISIEVRESRNGVAMLEPAKLLSIAGAIDGDIRVSSDGSNLIVVKTARTKFEFDWRDPAEFPESQAAVQSIPIEIDAEAFRTAVEGVLPSTDRTDSSSRWSVRGVLFDIQPSTGQIVLVGTDTRRLALVASAASNISEANAGEYVLPTHVFSVLLKGADKNILLVVNKNTVVFISGSLGVSTRLVEGRFPPYRDIIPKKFTHEIKLPKSELVDCFRDARLVSTDEMARTEVVFSGGKLRLTAGSTSGRSDIVMDGLSFHGDVEFAVNPQYMLDGLKLCNDEFVTLHVTDGQKPIVMAGDNWKYLVMPLTA
jgi:DNA polymerase III subunit beta